MVRNGTIAQSVGERGNAARDLKRTGVGDDGLSDRQRRVLVTKVARSRLQAAGLSKRVAGELGRVVDTYIDHLQKESLEPSERRRNGQALVELYKTVTQVASPESAAQLAVAVGVKLDFSGACPVIDHGPPVSPDERSEPSEPTDVQGD